MAKILVALGMGGHTSQILRLVDKLDPQHELCYLICTDDKTSKAKIRKPGPTYYMKNPRDMKDKFLGIFLGFAGYTIFVFLDSIIKKYF